MVFAALLTITVRVSALTWIMVWVSAIVFLRELGVTSIRLVCSGTGAGVIAASFFGKAKTVTQIACIVVILVEYAINAGCGVNTLWIASYIFIALMTIMTVGSGLDYLKTYMPYISSDK